MRPPLSSDPRPWNPTWDGMIADGGLFLEKLDPPPRETIASRIHDFIIYLGIARNKVSKWERIEKITIFSMSKQLSKQACSALQGQVGCSPAGGGGAHSPQLRESVSGGM